MDEAKKEMAIRFDLAKEILSKVGLNIPEDLELGIRLTKDFYDKNKDFILSLVKKWGKPALLEMWDEKFFYFVTKYEWNFVDVLGKAAALTTDQIDVENAATYDISFTDKDGKKKMPTILHLSPSGAIERVIYALLEKAAKESSEGKKPELPLWLSPTQVRIIPIKEEFLEFSKKMSDKISQHDIRVDIDDRNESISKRIRDAEKNWIRYILVIGEKEMASENLNIRDRHLGSVREMAFEDFIKEIEDFTKNKPHAKLNESLLLSERPQIMV